jgi:hypothetical protein
VLLWVELLSPLLLSSAIELELGVKPWGFKLQLELSFLLQVEAKPFFPLQVVLRLYFKQQLEVEQELFSLLWAEPRLYSLLLEGQEPFSLQLVQEVASMQL